jgi:hypothetical protein
MNNLLNQGWYALEFAWSRARDEINGHLIMLVMIVAVLLLIWNFLSPQVKKGGS